jgi:hypothetical protein
VGHPIVRAFLASLAGVVAIFGLIVGIGSCQHGIGWFHVRVVNDTRRPVTIQPCWDPDCLNFRGLPAAVIRPGAARTEPPAWPNDAGQQIVLAIHKPGGKPWQFAGCLVTSYVQGQTTGTVRVSQMRPCFTGTESGGGG